MNANSAYSHRTLFRHLLFMLMLLFFLYYVSGSVDNPRIFLNWIFANVWILLTYLISAIVAGIAAHYCVTGSIVIQYVKKITDNMLLQKWASCSRCVSWWVAFINGFILSLIFWQGAIGIKILTGLYFGMLSASIASFIAVLIFIVGWIKDEKSR